MMKSTPDEKNPGHELICIQCIVTSYDLKASVGIELTPVTKTLFYARWIYLKIMID